jgi:hypothetical protein
MAKYVACREKNVIFTRELAGRGIVSRERLMALLAEMPVADEVNARIRAHIARDFGAHKKDA